MAKEVIQILISEIVCDSAFQPRYAFDLNHAKDLRDFMIDGDIMPPIELRRITDRDNKLYLVDGWHRIDAHKKLGRDVIDAYIEDCDYETAIEHSMKANMIHGMKLTNGEKWTIIRKTLANPRYKDLSERQIAARIGVSHTLVRRVKAKDAISSPDDEETTNPEYQTHTNRLNTQVEYYKSQNNVLQKTVNEQQKMIAELSARLSALENKETRLTPTNKPVFEHRTQPIFDPNSFYPITEIAKMIDKCIDTTTTLIKDKNIYCCEINGKSSIKGKSIKELL